MVKKQYNESQLTGTISNDRQTVYGTATAGSGVTDHSRLFNRDKEEQHPIEAITGLRAELDAKLDSETALPLIEEALQSKAAGLYFDAKKELARKSYWYLCSEIDPVTKQGTKESIISGPYDLGAGGGGGGGGVTQVSITFFDSYKWMRLYKTQFNLLRKAHVILSCYSYYNPFIYKIHNHFPYGEYYILFFFFVNFVFNTIIAGSFNTISINIKS